MIYISKRAFRGLIALLLIIFVAAAAWFIGWDITGEINPAMWGATQVQPEEPPADDNTDETETPEETGVEDEENETEGEENAPAAPLSLHVCALSENNSDIELSAVGGNIGGGGFGTVCPSCGQLTATQSTLGTATCTSGATIIISCSSCGYHNSSTGNPLGHRGFSWVVTKTPTADSTGTASYKCGYCSYVEETATVYALPEDPVKEGYHFVGWYYDEELTEPYDGGLIFEDTALYAKLEINILTVTFDSDGGTEIDEITTDWNTTITTVTPEKTGYNFLGWYKLDGELFDDIEVITANTALKARWQIKTFTVTFYVEGALYTSVTVDYGSLLSEVADVVAVYAVNILSFENVNSETPPVTASEMHITDDMTVTINNPTVWQKIINSKYTPYVIGCVVVLISICVIVGFVVAKKKRGQ